MIDFRCPHCDSLFHIPEEFVGTTGSCRSCNKPITIEAPEVDEEAGGEYPDFTVREPTIVVVHVETTGSSSRRSAIIELGSMIIDLDGREIDSYSSLANPGDLLPSKIEQRTGLTDEMLESAPFPADVVQHWCDWIGPHALVLCQHAHFHAKFLSAALLREGIEPPFMKMIDVVHWAKELELPVDQYRFRNLLEAIGHDEPYRHRGMDMCRGLAALIPYLAHMQVGLPPLRAGSHLQGTAGRASEPEHRLEVMDYFQRTAESLDDMCGDSFTLRRAKVDSVEDVPAAPPAPAPAASSNGSSGDELPFHPPEWFNEMRDRIEQVSHLTANDATDAAFDGIKEGRATPWREAVWAANEEKDRAKQGELCVKAIRLGALDPWPYEHLVNYYVHAKKYESALRVADRYFRMDSWKNPRWTDVSMSLLKKLNKLERYLSADQPV